MILIIVVAFVVVGLCVVSIDIFLVWEQIVVPHSGDGGCSSSDFVKRDCL